MLIGTEARKTAKQKARYGRRDWIAWTDKNGVDYADLFSAASVKLALLSVGTQGFFVRYSANDGISVLSYWHDGTRWLRQFRAGVL